MKLRTQLLIINLASIILLVAAVVYSYSRMLLNFNQAGLLTLIAVGAGVISTIAYWFMTQPIIHSVTRLIHFAENGDSVTIQDDAKISGPTEVRRLTESVHRMKQRMHEDLVQLENMEQTRRELIANVSHDLRTPIASIQSFVEALEDGVIDDYETSRRYLGTIHREIGRLSDLIDDLFELSKLEAGQQLYSPRLGHIDQVILEVLEGCSVNLQEKHMHVAVSVADDIPALPMMYDKVIRVVRNLVDNAIRHSPRGSEIQIAAKRWSDRGVVEVIIRDQGEGVDVDDAQRIFERFYRVDKSRSRDSGGAGLGLAIARSLIELHGGAIGVRSRQGQSGGSEFWFTLPLKISM
jgi:two-component system sensor histidine kinase SaeS